MLRVMTVVGTRPEVIKLSRVIAELELHTQHLLVHTGQNFDFELNGVFFSEMGIRQPDHQLSCARPSPADTAASVISGVDSLIARLKPDAFLVLGDTNSAMAAYSAKRRHVPVFHMEAGNRCFDDRVPEEINRRLIDHISDVNLVYSEHARLNLLREGLPTDRVIKTGTPMREVIFFYQNQITQSTILESLGLTRFGYFLVSAHREDNVDGLNELTALASTLQLLVERFNLPVVFSVHPRTRQRLMEHSISLPPQVICSKPFGFFDYIALQAHSRCVISDSGTITEEASIVGFPAVTIRRSHERQEGMDSGTLILAGLKPKDVLHAVEVTTHQYWEQGLRPESISDYNNRRVAMQVCRTIMGYGPYVNRIVWRTP